VPRFLGDMGLPEGDVRENTEILSTRAWKIAEVLE
jgi:hypothetical protein